MVAILFVVTVLIFLLVDFWMQRKRAQQPAETPAGMSNDGKPVAIYSEPYFHPTHSWARITDEVVTVGVDEFSQKLIGKVQRLDVPQVGSYLKQGETGWKLHSGKRSLPQASPVEGEVIEINPALFKDPELINKAPYGNGWILKVRPNSLRQNLKNLLHGEQARRWIDTVRSQFILRFAKEVGPVCQDGGELIQGAGDLLSENEWKEVLREYFLADE